jgi:hypothetical protein
MLFPHDFPGSGRMALPSVQEKCRRRIESFRQFGPARARDRVRRPRRQPNAWQQEQLALANGTIADAPRDWREQTVTALRRRFPEARFRVESLADLGWRPVSQ